MPLVIAHFAPLERMVMYQYSYTIAFLVLLGYLTAKTGGSSVLKAILRITLLGTVTMGLTAYVGYLFNIGI
jgi:VIT1/CCC1 family predicted Fe2+/Mn2+ transporter